MKPIVLADSIGVMLLAAVTAMPLGCVPQPKVTKADPEPFIAVTGNYSVLVTGAHPTPAPSPTPVPGPNKPDGCLAGCRCNGTGRERTGDGLALVPCRCPDNCACKAGKACPACDATGRLPASAVEHAPFVIPPCATGSCKVPRR